MGMRRVIWIVGVGVVLAACGGSSPDLLESVPTPTASVDTVVTPTPSTSVPATTPVTRPATTLVDDATASTQTTEPEQRDVNASQRPVLAIESALLPDDAFAPPWEIQWRNTDAFAYGAGPNQTDCSPYWRIEEFRGGGGGHAMWWVDGGNANHYVTRLDGAAEDLFLDDLAVLADACPTVRWGEGGSFTIESVPVDDGFGFRFIELESKETTWFGVTMHGDLVSVLDVPTWLPVTPGTRPLEFDGDDLNRLVSQMYALLVESPELPRVPTTTTPPVKTVPSTNVPQITQTTTLPTTTALPTFNTTTTTTTTEPPDDSLARLLLQTADLPAEFGDVEIDEYRQDGADDDLVDTCPPAISIERINLVLEWSVDATTHDDLDFSQMIGRASSGSEAGDIVAQFAQVADCDLSSSFGAESVASGGPVAIAGADAAASLLIESLGDEFVGELFVLAVDDLIVVVTLGGDGPAFDSSLADELAVRAVKKIAAASR